VRRGRTLRGRTSTSVSRCSNPIGYDQGFRLIANRLKDKPFGLSFAVRQVDPMQVPDLASQALGQARTDITIDPGDMAVLSLGIQERSPIVRRLGGYLDGRALTRARAGRGEIVSDGTTLTPEPLFPFSQVTLAQTAKTLESWGVTAEVVGISAAAPAANARPKFRAAA